ncbi:MAG: hypothetical protein ACRC54_05115 [Fusobacteriaceae bacterium]
MEKNVEEQEKINQLLYDYNKFVIDEENKSIARTQEKIKSFQSVLISAVTAYILFLYNYIPYLKKIAFIEVCKLTIVGIFSHIIIIVCLILLMLNIYKLTKLILEYWSIDRRIKLRAAHSTESKSVVDEYELINDDFEKSLDENRKINDKTITELTETHDKIRKILMGTFLIYITFLVGVI